MAKAGVNIDRLTLRRRAHSSQTYRLLTEMRHSIKSDGIGDQG